jgi:SAM-dependent methyltransferase
MPNPPPCPCCDSPLPAPPFYTARGVPVQSNLLAESRSEAVDLPRGDLSLRFCPTCGFVTNAAFDPATQQLTAQYEATQGFSPTFNAFARQLAQRWASRYLGPDKVALEIGCGRGEFVSLLHELSGCRAIGFDPILQDVSPPGPVRLIGDEYSDEYADLLADLVVCRHTLEHVRHAGEFVRTVRRAMGERTGTVAAFEVPDALRILREGAFWDLYYEHCSYFTPGSLARLFRASRFDVFDLRREYDDQYLILEAKPSARPTAPRLDIEDDLLAVTDAVNGFPAAAERQLARWRRVIDETLAAGKRLALWGSGSKAVGFLSTLGITDDRIPLVVDINPRKRDTFLPGTGQRIVSPDALVDYRPDAVILMNPVYRAEVQQALDARSLRPDLMTL